MIEPEFEAKRLEILKEMLPAARRFGVLNDRTLASPTRLQAREQGARVLGIELRTVDVRSPADFAAALETLRAGGAQAVDIPQPAISWCVSAPSASTLFAGT
jgi:putative tryptophan/tyrosine transport system substrate-binding protein